MRRKTVNLLIIFISAVMLVVSLVKLINLALINVAVQECSIQDDTIQENKEHQAEKQEPCIKAICYTESQFEEEILKSNYYDESLVVAGGSFQEWCKLAYAEGGVDGPEAMAAVAATTLNRIENPDFPDDFWGVVKNPSAYNSVEDGRIMIKEEKVSYECTYSMVPENLRHAVWLALAVGYDPTMEKLKNEALRNGINDLEKYVGKGALYFYNPDAIDKEEIEARKYVKCKVKIGSQYFYTYWDKE